MFKLFELGGSTDVRCCESALVLLDGMLALLEGGFTSVTSFIVTS